jgi:hypothetical protein
MGGTAASAAAAKYEMMTEALLLGALGFTLSGSKCEFAPTLSLELLGFDINAAEAVTNVPSEKMQHCLQLINAALEGRFTCMPWQSLMAHAGKENLHVCPGKASWLMQGAPAGATCTYQIKTKTEA